MGRKSKYTPEVVQRITEAIRLGATYELACGYAGIHKDTFYTWMNTKPDFSDLVKDAEGKGAVGWLAKIEKAANEGSWQAAAWKLERRYAQQYGRQIQEHQGSMDVNYTGLTISDIDREIMAIVSRAGQGKIAGPRNRAQLPMGSKGEE